MALMCTPENFRAEIARHMLSRLDISELIQLSPNRVTDYVNGTLPLTDWAGHNIGWAINHITGLRVFGVDQDRGVIRPRRGRPPLDRIGMGLGREPYVRKRRPYRRRS